MIRKYLIISFFVLLAANIYAEERESFFAAPLVETVNYGTKGLSMGYGFIIGGGNSAAAGLRFIYAAPLEEGDITVMETCIFLRFALLDREYGNGLFVQVNAGSTIFSFENTIELPADAGAVSIGLTAGWRFLPGKKDSLTGFYIEPYLRGGYPYYGGAGVSAGILF